jgi:hypothetical protein
MTTTDRVRFRIEACNPGKDVKWFTVHGFEGEDRRPRVVETARSMREHMEPAWTVRILELTADGARVIWKE